MQAFTRWCQSVDVHSFRATLLISWNAFKWLLLIILNLKFLCYWRVQIKQHGSIVALEFNQFICHWNSYSKTNAIAGQKAIEVHVTMKFVRVIRLEISYLEFIIFIIISIATLIKACNEFCAECNGNLWIIHGDGDANWDKFYNALPLPSIVSANKLSLTEMSRCFLKLSNYNAWASVDICTVAFY